MSDSVQASTPFLYARVWLHWLDTDEVRQLSGRALKLWVLLLAHAAGQDTTDPFKATLARESGIHEENLQTVFKELEQAGLLERLIGSGYGDFGRRSTQYRLLSPPSVREREAAAQDVLRAGAGAGVKTTPPLPGVKTTPPLPGVKKDHRGVKKDHRGGVKNDHRGGVKTTPHSEINSQDNSQDTHGQGVCDQEKGGPGPDLVQQACWRVDALELVQAWLVDVVHLERKPLQKELDLAFAWIRDFGKEHAWELTRAADQALLERGLLKSTVSFCGLATVVDAERGVVLRKRSGGWG